MQTIIVIIVVTTAILLALRHIIHMIKNKDGNCSGCPNCDKKTKKE